MLSIDGKTFGRLFVVGAAHVGRDACRVRACICICGNFCYVSPRNLVSGMTKSCGCLVKENSGPIRHGLNKSPEHRIWVGMRSRCRDSGSKDYKWYGARGIKVCKRWNIFENFLADMGCRPPGKSLDRINNEKGYSPNNCRWATAKQQANNRRVQ